MSRDRSWTLPARSLARQTSGAATAATVGVLSGLLLDATIAFKFGAGAHTDAYFVGSRFYYVVSALALVAANQVVLPTMSHWWHQRSVPEARRLVGGAFVLGLGASTALGVLVAMLATPLVLLTAPGLDQVDRDVAVVVVRILSAALPLAVGAEVLRAFLNAREVFAVPAAMNALSNVPAALLILAMAGSTVQTAAWALLAGAVVRLLVLGVLALRHGLVVTRWSVEDGEELRSLVRRCTAPLVGGGLVPLVRIVEQVILSFFPAGSITYLNYAYRLVAGLGGTVVFRSVVTTLMPRLSRSVARNETAESSRLVAGAIGLMLCVSLPVAALVVSLSGPGTALAFGNGAFDASDVTVLSLLLVMLALSLPADALQRALLLVSFARLDTRTPLRNAWVGAVANLVLLLVFLTLGAAADAPYLAAAAYVVTKWIQVVHAARWLRRDSLYLPMRRFGRSITCMALASGLAMGAGLLAVSVWFEPGHDSLFRELVLTSASALPALVLLSLGAVAARRAWPGIVGPHVEQEHRP